MSQSSPMLPTVKDTDIMWQTFEPHRNRSKTYLASIDGTSDDDLDGTATSTSAPGVSYVPVPTRSKSMHQVRFAMGNHRTDNAEQGPSYPVDQPDSEEDHVAPLESAEERRLRVQKVREHMRKHEMEQLRQDKLALERQLELWKIKRDTEKQFLEAEKSLSRSATTLTSIAVDIAAFETGEFTKQVAKLLATATEMLEQQKSIQAQQLELIAAVSQIVKIQREHQETLMYLTKTAPANDAAASKKPRSSSRLSELGSIFGGSGNK
jgi:hypothetical protein